MRDDAPQPVRLADYRPFTHLIDSVSLVFRLAPSATRVVSRIAFRPNPASSGGDLVLDGEGLKLISARIDGRPVEPAVERGKLTVPAGALPDGPFTWEAEVEIDPAGNTTLEGLYMSNGMYCTQCEAEGFRRITFYPDRPDVMAPFTVRIESDLPVLLSNGNPVARGEGWAEWHDPWPKPAYLFALVAGDLVARTDSFTTASGREVALNLWVREGDLDKTDFAMEALKKAMRWDEEVYGREYDLEVFNIVAVDDFNMGAMENKGLNIFNSAAVLASPETATDASFERIEAIIAHEYFHNWTGNRITCRDWFQLCLKEGLTVFRDQQFSADQRGEAVQRICNVLQLRARQFREDAGPLAHPVRPESFIEISNFYTATVYEKGAEVVRMLKLLAGEEGWRKALDLYFARHDGQAVTIEDWLKVFEDATGRDLAQFKRWYSQAGTPRLEVAEEYRDGTYTLHFRQYTPPTPGQEHKEPLVIPIAVGLLSPNGDEVVPTTVLEMTRERQSFRFEGLASRPVPSLLRGFSAPVILRRQAGAQERAFLLAHDTDPFNRWEAGRTLAQDGLMAMVREGAPPDAAFLDALARLLGDEAQPPAFRALALELPSEDSLAQALHEAGTTPDPDAIHAARETLARAMAERMQALLARLHEEMAVPGPYRPEAEAAGRRALRGAALALLSRLDGGALARAQFESAGNMTERFGALACLVPTAHGPAALEAFYRQWRGERLVIDKWFTVQVARARPEAALEVARALASHPDFNWKNPNRFRALISGFATMNPAGFHRPDGQGYDFVADWLIRLDAVNPQTAARLSGVFETWRRYDTARQEKIRAALIRILETPGLSRDTTEMVSRLLG